MDAMVTTHSEYLPLQSVFLRPLEQAFREAAKVEAQWKDLNYLSRPDYAKAVDQYSQFESLIRSGASEVYPMEGQTDLSLDSLYCRDASVMTDFGVILCNMGKEARKGEPALHRSVYQALGIPILGEIQAPGTLEGGDLAWIDSQTLAVGHSYRSNMDGIKQLKALLSPRGIEVMVADLPHFKGPSDVFHLMSILSPVDKDLAVVYSPLMPIGFRQELLDRGFSLVEVPDAEFDSLGSNVLALGPRECVMVQGNPKTESALREAGCAVHTYSGAEMSIKGGGGPTCLTRPYLRRKQPTA